MFLHEEFWGSDIIALLICFAVHIVAADYNFGLEVSIACLQELMGVLIEESSFLRSGIFFIIVIMKNILLSC